MGCWVLYFIPTPYFRPGKGEYGMWDTLKEFPILHLYIFALPAGVNTGNWAWIDKQVSGQNGLIKECGEGQTSL